MTSRTPLAATGLLAALLLTLPAVPAATAQPVAAPAAPAVTATGIDTLAWSLCAAEDDRDRQFGLPRADVLCASLPVPVDYARPEGRTIDLHVRRITATGARSGVLFGNPGGPGGDARQLWYNALDDHGGAPIDQLRGDHDLVIVQPRGLAQSGDLECASDRPALELSQAAIDARAVACMDADPDLVRSFTTENVVRDHEQVRARMGLERVSFLGYSYGTAIGMMYQTLFPGSLERLVLDSATGPTDVWWRDMARSQQAHRHEAVYYALEWIAEHDAMYELGGTAEEVYRAVTDLDASLGVTRPRFLPPGGGSVETGSVRLDTVLAGSSGGAGPDQEETDLGYMAVLDFFSRHPGLWSDVAWSVSGRVTGSRPDAPTPAQLLERAQAMSDEPEQAEEQLPVRIQSSDGDVYFRIVTCNEDTSADDPLAEALLGSSDSAAGLGSLAAAGSVLEEAETLAARADRCPFEPTSVPPATTANPMVAVPMVIQADHDPNTPGLHGPQAAAATGGVLVRVMGTVHGHFDTGNAEVDAVVLHYLRTGEVAPGQYLGTPRPSPAAPPWERRP